MKVKTQNDIAWEKLFNKYNILMQINKNGMYQISASQIKEFREPRLMAKFDHQINLPQIFKDNNLSILPITRGDYLISNFKTYHSFEPDKNEIIKFSLPNHIQSLDYNNITSEAIAINCSFATGILKDFLEDDELIPTVSGRMSSGNFQYNIDMHNKNKRNITIKNSQIEIDAAFEGIHSLTIIEAKRDLSKDFLIRQLYYPYRLWKNKITKPVRTVFLVYTNGLYKLYEYKFQDTNNYNSLILVKQKIYTLEDTTITSLDLKQLLKEIKIIKEPEIPFPQADNFARIINLCELLNEQELSRNDVTERYAFDARQTNYYTDAARYLGLVKKKKTGQKTTYTLSPLGEEILKLDFKKRQLAYCKCILSHQVFNRILDITLQQGEIPNKNDIVTIMKTSNLYNIKNNSTFNRRASTITQWINWILEIINE